jgi:glycosidase
LVLDRLTGLPGAIELPASTGLPPVSCRTSLTLHVGGEEVRALAGGLDYPGYEELGGLKLRPGPIAAPGDGPGGDGPNPGTVVRVAAELPGWAVVLHYRLRDELPRAEMRVELARAPGESRPLRNLELELALGLDPSQWAVHAPGNRLVPGTCLAELPGPLTISPPTGSLGSPGLLVLSHRHVAACLVLWPFSRQEIGTVALVAETAGARLRVTTNLAGDPPGTEPLRYTGLNLDAVDVDWATVRSRSRPALSGLGVRSPGPKPTWARSATIYETQVGRSVFAGGWSYEPYPQLQDVTADLERIASLGFDTVQLMPRQPYPSYNVHDYRDIDVTYGGRDALLDLVQRAHGQGLRVVLDIVLHGVLDHRSVGDALARVRQSGVLEEPEPARGDMFADTPASLAALRRAWCQHIADFAPYWVEGSPAVHPLTAERPEWFCRDSAQDLLGVYTQAFDLADESWQDWFCQTVLGLVEDYSVDGFRFDAPTYNNFANWSTPRRAQASTSSTGCVALFERLRHQLKARFPEVLMFTEPSGVVLRESMDMNYNYDELWLVPALMAEPGAVRVPLSGAQLAAWFDERDATLPADALTCHHLDSHDTFWWPAPGHKWRREQIGAPATWALTCCLALAGGPFMMFTGGEVGMEDDLARLLQLRRQREELRQGGADFSAAELDDDAVFAVLRHHGPSGLLVLVNLSPRATTTVCRLRRGWRVVGPAHGEAVKVELEPYGSALLEVRQ